jgi:hypothetical protein
VCSRHFIGNNPTLLANSIPRNDTERSGRAIKRAVRASSLPSFSDAKRLAPSTSNQSSSCESSTRQPSVCTVSNLTTDEELMSASPGEQYFSDYNVHELPIIGNEESNGDVQIKARLEMLEAETKHLRVLLNAKSVPQKFRIEQIANNNSLSFI